MSSASYDEPGWVLPLAPRYLISIPSPGPSFKSRESIVEMADRLSPLADAVRP